MLRSPWRKGYSRIRGASLLLCVVLAAARARAQQPPQAQLDNGVLHAVFELPDARDGYYRGTRFDWSGVIADLTYAGHHFYGPWFVRTDPAVRDYIFTDAGIVAGVASSITGPVEEYLKQGDGSALGYDEAKPGGAFVKLGVGTLRKLDAQKYSPYRSYPIVDTGTWTTRVRRTSIEFQQRLIDPASGYGYLYTKTIRLLPHQPRMVIEHRLKNLGRLPIETNVFDHNFLVLDHQQTGPDFSITLPFAIQPEKPIRTEMGSIEGNRIVYKRKLKDGEAFTVHILGFGTTPKDNDIRVENSSVGAGVRITGDRPLQSLELWSIRTVLAMEPYLKIALAPGRTMHWSYTYEYYTLPPGH